MADKLSSHGEPRVSGFFILALLAIVLVTSAGLVIYRVLPDWETRSDFGGMFGSVDALFSGLALAGVIYALTLQRTELRLQREELQLSRREMERSATAQERTELAVAEQARYMRLTARAQLVATLTAIEAETLRHQDPAMARALQRFGSTRRHVEGLTTILAELESEGLVTKNERNETS